MFDKFSRYISNAAGSSGAFLAALLLIIIWAVTGFIMGFSDTHQLIINTSTTIITFLMVFVIQASQNHDTKALHLKLDELLRATQQADTHIAQAEDFTSEQVEHHIQQIKQSKDNPTP